MSAALPTVSARELIRALERGGFVFRRQRGSHRIHQHPSSGRRISVPVHTGDVPRGTLRRILHDADLSVERFLHSASLGRVGPPLGEAPVSVARGKR